jgi:long-chain acyl-CoA synthetase
MSIEQHSTLPWLFERSVERYGENVLMLEKRGEAYQRTTYTQARESVHRCAAGLISHSVKPGDRICLISEGRNDWVIAELGILYAGAINVPLSVKIEERSELKFRITHSGCKMAIVSGNHAQKILQLRKDLPELEQVILLDEVEGAENVFFFRDLLIDGELFLKTRRDQFVKRWHAVQESDPANICYTSGTTADPKGIILTHRNYTVNVDQSASMIQFPPSFTTLLILPWDHSFAHTAGIYTMIKNGASFASVQLGKTPMETLRNIPINIKEIKPSFLLSVPALAKNFRKNIEKAISDKGKNIARLFNHALETAYKYNGDGWNRGKGWRAIHKPLYAFYDKIIFNKIRDNFGGNLQFLIGGGALLDIELQRFFYALGIPMFQGYGLTEAAPVISANTPTKHKLGSSGTIVPDLEIKICDDKGTEVPIGVPGEIVVRGENVMAGYWKNEKSTASTIRDGWLYSGDLGYMDKDGFLFVLGREKSLLISHDGEKYSPEGIEETIVAHSPYIEQLMLFNNQSQYTVALVVPNRDALLKWLRQHQLTCSTSKGQDAILRLTESEINAYKTGGKHANQFPDRWLPSAVAILGEGFTEQNKLMNSTLKMVRGKITEEYKSRIDYLFTAEGKSICNPQNRTIIARLEEN